MPIVAPLEPPAFAGEVQPLTALLLYQTEGRVLGTLHPLTATRRGQAAIGAALSTIALKQPQLVRQAMPSAMPIICTSIAMP